MAHHAYFYAGSSEEGIGAALHFLETEHGLQAQGNPDVLVLETVHLSVDDARRVGTFAAQTALTGTKKGIVLSATRLFHEAQNTFLKVFEEPPEGVVLILVVPAEGNLLPTLRSRLIPLPRTDGTHTVAPFASEFIRASQEEREKIITKLLARTKADKEQDKQAARMDAIHLIEGLMVATQQKRLTHPSEELDLLARDLDRFLPILHERSAPMKAIFEHLLIVLPETSLK